MKLIAIALVAVAVLGGGRFVRHRLATHPRGSLNPLARVNTQVHRINQ